MASATVKVTLGGSLGEGQYGTTVSQAIDQAASAASAVTASTLADTDVAAIQALEAAVTTAIANAAAGTVIAADPTSLALVNAITTAWNPVITAHTAAKAATAATITAAGAVGLTANVTVVVDKAKVTSINALKACLNAALLHMRGSGGLT